MPFENLPSARLPPRTLPLGLGCSRLGSVNGATEDEARALVISALDQGVHFFDTSNIYGQGDSERILGKIVGNRDDCLVCSKAGKHLSLTMRALLPFKNVLRTMVRHSNQARHSVAVTRSKPMPECWGSAHLLRGIDGSLRRLQREKIDIFMLHSPPVDIVVRGDAIRALERARGAGKIQIIGVSVDDVATAEAALKDSRVRALQVPMPPGQTAFDKVVQDAARLGVAIIAREILGGLQTISRQEEPARYARQRIIDVIRKPGISLPLVGVTRATSLNATIDAARAATAR